MSESDETAISVSQVMRLAVIRPPKGVYTNVSTIGWYAYKRPSLRCIVFLTTRSHQILQDNDDWTPIYLAWNYNTDTIDVATTAQAAVIKDSTASTCKLKQTKALWQVHQSD